MTQAVLASFARYDLEATLGQGGMGAVYRARDRATGTLVALKRLIAPSKSAQSVTALFEREYHVLTQLSHPAVIRVFDYGVDEHGPYYTMELLDGADLRGNGDVTSGELCAILCGVASALSLLHARRLVHRDVTSGNIRRIAPGKGKLIDFGALAPFGPSDRFVGTPQYAPPEAVLLQPLDGRADLYSLGVVMYRALTGRYPYRARTVGDLRAAWRVPPLPPSELSPSVPKALSDLAMSLIALDAAHRPRDAAEVMERLAMIGSVPRVDAEASRAHLVTPPLVGRADALRRARELVVGALRGHGRALVFSGPSGVGRSRMLDAAALEAQVLGATIARVLAPRGKKSDFGAICALFDHLQETGVTLAVPEVAIALRSRAEGSGLEHLGATRAEILAAASRLLCALSERVPLVLLADDLHELDEPSIATLSSLARDIAGTRLTLFGTVPEQALADAGLSLRVLLERVQVHPLEALDERGTRTLVRSLFGSVPNIDALARRAHRWSRGYPQGTMALAEHLLETGVVGYRGGVFSVPEAMEFSTLPTSLAATLEARARALSPLAVRLAQSFALSGWRRLSVEDCQRLCPSASAGDVFGAVDQLVTADVLGVEGTEYALRHEAWRTALTNSCNDVERTERHRCIANVLAARGGDVLAEAYHRMRAGEARGVEMIARYSAEFTSQGVEFVKSTELAADELGWLFIAALDAFEGRAARDDRAIAAIRRFVMLLGVYFDARWYFRVAGDVESALMREAGFYVWESLGDGMDAMPRLFEALRLAQAAYDASPEGHVHPPPLAIRHLVQYVVSAIAVGARTSNAELRRRLPRMLEPFSPLSPIVAAMKENSRSAAQSTVADYEGAADRLEPVVLALSTAEAASIQFSGEIQAACIYAIGAYRARVGIQRASEWLDRVAEHPSHASNVQRTRALLALQRGAWVEAEARHRAAEQYDMEHGSPQLFGKAALTGEIEVYARGLDLTALKQLIVAITPHAEHHEGWRPHLDCARGEYERLRGALEAALEFFDRATSATSPRRAGEHPDGAWYAAEASALETLLELGRLPECRERAMRSLSFGDGTASGTRYDGVKRALALCEAQLGDAAAAVARLDALVAHRKEMGSSGLGLGLLYEARALVEAWRDDQNAAQGFLTLATAELAPEEGSGFSRRLDILRRRLAEEDRARASISMRGAERPDDRAGRELSLVLSGCTDASGRASEGLSLLCRGAQASEGHLYLLGPTGLGLAASTADSEPPPGLVDHLSARMEFEFGALSDDGPVTMVTVAADAVELLSPFKASPDAKRSFHPVWIRANLGAYSSVVGVAALGLDDDSRPDQAVHTLAERFGDFLVQVGDTIVVGSRDAVTRSDSA